MAERLGVSRTHIRALFSDAAARGLVEFGRRGGHDVALTPVMIAAFDRFLADMGAQYDRVMSLVHQTYALANEGR